MMILLALLFLIAEAGAGCREVGRHVVVCRGKFEGMSVDRTVVQLYEWNGQCSDLPVEGSLYVYGDNACEVYKYRVTDATVPKGECDDITEETSTATATTSTTVCLFVVVISPLK